MAAATGATVAGAEAWDQDAAWRALVERTFRLSRALDGNDPHTGSGEKEIDMPVTTFLLPQMSGKPRFEMAPGRAGIDVTAGWEGMAPQPADRHLKRRGDVEQ